MLKRIFNKTSTTIGSAAFVLGAASLVSGLLGLLRDRILAGTFGAGDELDIYYAAFRIPDLVYSLLVAGAVSAAFIPVFVGYLGRDQKQAWYLANSVLNLMGLALAVVCLFLMIFTPWLVQLVAPGFSIEKLSLTSQLTRIMFLSPFFMGLDTVIGGILQTFRRFLIFSLGPIIYNLGIIFGALFLIKPFGLLGLAYGVALGALLHFLIQIPAVWFCGWQWQPVFDWQFSGVRKVFWLMVPRVFSLTLSQINLWLITLMASFLAVGSLAIYNLASNIWGFPLSVFGFSFVVAAFPLLSENAQKGDRPNFVKNFSLTSRQILFFTLPSAVLLIVLRSQIIRVILGTGQFDWQDTVLTYQTLAYFSLCLFAEALVLLFLRGFFAWEDTKTPFLIGLLATAVRLPLAWLLAKILGVPGLALGYSLGTIFYLIVLFLVLKKKIGFLDGRQIAWSGLKMALAALLAGGAAYLVLRLMAGFNVFIQTGLAGLAGVLVYLALAWLLRLKELNLLLKFLWRKTSAISQ